MNTALSCPVEVTIRLEGFSRSPDLTDEEHSEAMGRWVGRKLAEAIKWPVFEDDITIVSTKPVRG